MLTKGVSRNRLTYEGACRGYAGVWHAYIRLCMHLEQLIQLDCNLPLVHLQATPVCSSTCRLPTSSFILLLLIPPNSGVNACRYEHCRWQSFTPQSGAKLVADVLGACVCYKCMTVCAESSRVCHTMRPMGLLLPNICEVYWGQGPSWGEGLGSNQGQGPIPRVRCHCHSPLAQL